MVKIRISGDNFQEVREAADYMKKLFPTMNFTKPKEGTNPKYEESKFFSYGTPKILNKKPRKINFKARLDKLKSTKSKTDHEKELEKLKAISQSFFKVLKTNPK
jgi:hypothetical protein